VTSHFFVRYALNASGKKFALYPAFVRVKVLKKLSSFWGTFRSGAVPLCSKIAGVRLEPAVDNFVP
jgi:hypothetical protein